MGPSQPPDGVQESDSGREHSSLLADPSGTWVHLLGDVQDRRVLLIDETGSKAATLLREAGARVEHGGPVLLGHRPPDSPSRSFHAIVLAEVRLCENLLAAARARLLDDGLLLVIAHNRHSPLGWYDALRDGRSRPRESASSLRSVLGRHDLPVRAEYALLRSCASPSTVFEVNHPRQAELVLAGSNTLNIGARRRAVNALVWMVRRRRAAWLCPGLAVLSAPRPLQFLPVLGRIGVLGSAEVKLLYGEPVSHVDKFYGQAHLAAAEADALEQVEQAWPGLAPRLLERRGPRANRISWMAGRTLRLDGLSPAEGESWVLRAAAVLGELHGRLGSDENGSALLHGDFWLGNLLVDDVQGTITSVIDWSDSTRGDTDTDLRFLVDSWTLRSGALSLASEQLLLAVRAEFRAARSRSAPGPSCVEPHGSSGPSAGHRGQSGRLGDLITPARGVPSGDDPVAGPVRLSQAEGPTITRRDRAGSSPGRLRGSSPWRHLERRLRGHATAEGLPSNVATPATGGPRRIP